MFDNFGELLNGFSDALVFSNLIYGFIGTFLGTLVGVLPGIGPALAIGLLLPITLTVQPTQALIMFAAIYYGAMYGGSTTSILLNTPGESGSVITAVEGNKMARAGRAGAALATAAIGSFVAGTIATFTLALAAPQLAEIAIQVQPAGFLALIITAFATVGTLLGSSRVRGLLSLAVGLTIVLVLQLAHFLAGIFSGLLRLCHVWLHLVGNVAADAVHVGREGCLAGGVVALEVSGVALARACQLRGCVLHQQRAGDGVAVRNAQRRRLGFDALDFNLAQAVLCR